MALPDGFQSIGLIQHRAALVGRVLDAISGAPLAGVVVTLSDGPAAFLDRVAALRQGRPALHPERALTDGNGFFLWRDLPAGTYQLLAEPPGASTRYAANVAGSVVVPAQGTGRVDLALAPTVLNGLVRADAPAGPLGLARVRLTDSGEGTFTAADGSFSLSAVEAGAARRLEVSAQRYTAALQLVTLSQGQATSVPTVTLLAL